MIPYYPDRTPMVRTATHRLISAAVRASARRARRDPVGYTDARTSVDDARAALSLAAGAPADEVHPARGTWSAP